MTSRLPDPRFLLVGVLLACTSVESRVVHIGPPLRALAADGRVVFYRAPLTTPGAREVALVELTGYDDDIDPLTWSPRLERIAREAGGNGVVWMRTDRARGFVRVIAAIVHVP